MAGRPAAATPSPASLRVEVLKELQSILDDREVRDRIDRGPIAETKGREHWILHLLLRAHELGQAHLNTLIGTAYSNLTARLQGIEDRVQHLETVEQGVGDELHTRLETVEAALAERVSKEVGTSLGAATEKLSQTLLGNLDAKWKPVGESIETFARSSHQLTKDLSDTYRVATQTRLLLNENARRIIDMGRDLVALEESLKLALTKVLEEGLQPLEERLAALESRLGVEAGNGVHGSEPPAQSG
jgi:hypothetical protein